MQDHDTPEAATVPAANGQNHPNPTLSTRKAAPDQEASNHATPKQPTDAGSTSPEPEPKGKKTKQKNPIDLLRKLVARANAGEMWAIRRLKGVLDDNPSFWRRAGDLTAVAEQAWITLVAGSDRLAIECTKRKLAELKDELQGSNPTPMESLLVDTIAVAWLGCQHAEIQASAPTTGSIEQATWKLKRAESSQRRLLTATKTLATVRTLMSKGLAPANSLKLFTADGTG
jgi:hypothetical protein